MIKANDPNRRSWIKVDEGSDFPIQNIPFGVFIPEDDIITTGTRIGDTAIDLSAMQQLGYFKDIEISDDVFLQDTLNDFIALGRGINRQVRDRIAEIFDENNAELRDNEEHKARILFPADKVQMLMPIFSQDYTDFYSSREHATNVGTMFRDPDNALLPNWLHLPVGYHGRSSTIVISGEPIHRPMGQRKPKDADKPVFGPSVRVDFELEMAFITGEGKAMGQRISTEEAEEYIFGMVLFNDWSARDLQTWEYVPLGPFLAKNFGSSISPWVVTMDALEPYRCEGPKQEVEVLDYLKTEKDGAFDINISVAIQPENQEETVVSNSNFKYMYWSMAQQLAHHTVNGCKINPGDLMGSGTISGPTPDSYGSMLELAWNATKPIPMNGGGERTFIEDNDTVIMRGYCNNGTTRIGFGEVSCKILPAIE
ncbi:MAG: fumarylacetoacetase [Bacteroidetes bacterium]|nr:MAG: fumarylacetoacetase [Bacteroidota bacterium]